MDSNSWEGLHPQPSSLLKIKSKNKTVDMAHGFVFLTVFNCHTYTLFLIFSRPLPPGESGLGQIKLLEQLRQTLLGRGAVLSQTHPVVN